MIPVLIWPEAMHDTSAEVWRSAPDDFRALVDRSDVFRLHPLGEFAEAEFIGIDGERAMPRGPLAVAAFGYDPPVRSVQFQVDLLSIDESGIVQPVTELSEEDTESVTEQFPRLNTRTLTLVPGSGQTHGLVWEDGSLDLYCPEPEQAIGQPFGSVQIEGDGERILRQLVEDSANLLDDLELNRRRAGEGLAKANLLWPWAFGFRPDLPNLALRRGGIARVRSESLSLAGLCRLVGYQHEYIGHRKGMFLSDKVLQELESGESTVLVDEVPGQFAKLEREEELAHAINDLSRLVAGPRAMGIVRDLRGPLAILCPSRTGYGLGLIARSGAVPGAPFEPKALDDERLPIFRSFEVIESALSAGKG